jgi:hypothetical protein
MTTEKEQEVFYKVITKDRYSAFVKNKKIRVHYPVNDWAVPVIKGSSLTAWITEESAENWRSHSSYKKDLIIVPCVCKNVRRQQLHLLSVRSWQDDLSLDGVLEFWKMVSRCRKNKSYGKLYSRFEITNREDIAVNASSIKCLK